MMMASALPKPKPHKRKSLLPRGVHHNININIIISIIGFVTILICIVTNIIPSFSLVDVVVLQVEEEDVVKPSLLMNNLPSSSFKTTTTTTAIMNATTTTTTTNNNNNIEKEKSSRTKKKEESRQNQQQQQKQAKHNIIQNNNTTTINIINKSSNNIKVATDNNNYNDDDEDKIALDPLIQMGYQRLQRLDWEANRTIISSSSPSSGNFLNDVKNNNNNNNIFSACVMIQDENHRLSEWLAYHWYMMSLRHLVVLIDPKSLTSPISIINKWRPLFVRIDIWTDKDIKYRNFGNTPFQEFTRRQKYFYGKCATYLKSYNRTWTSFFDVDEYLTLEEIIPITTSNNTKKATIIDANTNTNTTISTKHVPLSSSSSSSSMFFPGAILQRIQDPMPYARHLIRNDTSICIPVHRVQFGAKEDVRKIKKITEELYHGKSDQIINNGNDVSSNKETNLSSSSSSTTTNSSSSVNVVEYINTLSMKMETLRFVWRANKSRDNKKSRQVTNGPPKSLLNVRYAPKNNYGTYGIHWIIKPDCNYNKWTKPMLYIHHYKGSIESYFARSDDPRRTLDTFTASQIDTNVVYDDKLLPWIQNFIKYVGGTIMAQHLLDGVGEIINNNNISIPK